MAATDRVTAWGLRSVPGDLRARYLGDGSWTDDTFATYLDRRAAAAPGLRVRIWSDERPCTTTVADLHRQAARVAGGLAARGVGPGDVIAYQMPNWAETLAVIWAGFRLGATVVPIIHFYGPDEVRFIVRQSGARVLVTPPAFGGVDHLANLAAVRADLDGLDTVVVAGTADEARGVPGGVTLADLAAAAPARRARRRSIPTRRRWSGTRRGRRPTPRAWSTATARCSPRSASWRRSRRRGTGPR